MEYIEFLAVDEVLEEDLVLSEVSVLPVTELTGMGDLRKLQVATPSLTLATSRLYSRQEMEDKRRRVRGVM